MYNYTPNDAIVIEPAIQPAQATEIIRATQIQEQANTDNLTIAGTKPTARTSISEHEHILYRSLQGIKN